MPEAKPEIVDWVARVTTADAWMPEVLETFPDLTPLDAYAVQRAVAERQAERGDRIIGYKAALTSKAMQAKAGIDEPVLGTLLGSRVCDPAEPVSLKGMLHATLEPEVAVVLGTDLQGPGVTPVQAMAAIAGYLPCVEIGDVRTGTAKRSLQQTIVGNTFNGADVFGSPMVSPSGIDLRLEGMVLTINGEVRGSATAVTVLDNPIHSVAFMANKLGELGHGLKAGMVLMTGSIVASIPMHPGDVVHVAFTRLGQVQVRFAE